MKKTRVTVIVCIGREGTDGIANVILFLQNIMSCKVNPRILYRRTNVTQSTAARKRYLRTNVTESTAPLIQYPRTNVIESTASLIQYFRANFLESKAPLIQFFLIYFTETKSPLLQSPPTPCTLCTPPILPFSRLHSFPPTTS